MLLKFCILVFFILVGLWTLAAWLHLPSPAHMLLILPKIFYSACINLLLILYLILLLAYSITFLLVSTTQTIDPFYVITYFLLWTYTLAGFIYYDCIRHAPVNGSPIHPLRENPTKKKYPHKVPTYHTTDFTTQINASHCTLYVPHDSPNANTCLFYLDYNTWNLQPTTSHTSYLKDLALSQGYSFCQYCAPATSDNIHSTIVNHITHSLTLLQHQTPITQFILCGRGEGGHLVLLTAYSSTPCEDTSPSIKGVLSLYPYADLSKESICLSDLDIPTFIIHGTHDSTVPVATTRELYSLMQQQKKTIDYLELPYVEHGFDRMLIHHSVVGHKIRREITHWLYTYFRP